MSAKKPYRLTAAFVSSVTRPGRYGDRRGGHGLSLRVKPTKAGKPSKTWSQRIRINGKLKQLGLGSYPVVTLARAREKALDNARRVERGEDISKPSTPVPTLFEAFDIVIALRRINWRGEKTQWNWHRSKQVFDEIGSIPVSAVKPQQVQDCIAGTVHENQNTAYKARSHLCTVMEWAITQGHRSTNPAPPEIMHVFGKPRPAVIHRTMPYNLVSEAIANLRAAENTWWANRLCLIFLILTGVRSKNVRLATWAEIDLRNACWTLKHTRMKSGEPFLVPLSRQALQVLAYAKLLGGGSGSDLIFPPKRSLEPIRPSHLAVIMTRLHISSSPHGFRQCITNWARGSKKRYAKGPVEMLLAHVPSKAVREAYETDDFYDLRTPIMQHWADFVSKPIGPITPPVKLGPSAPYIDDEFTEPLRQIMQEWDDFNSRTTTPDTTSETKPKAPAKEKSQKVGKSQATRASLSKPTRKSPTDDTPPPQKYNWPYRAALVALR